MSHGDLGPRKIDLFLYVSIHFVVVYECHFVVQPNRLNYGTFEHVLEKSSEYRWEITRENKRGRTEMTSGLREIFWKTNCILPLQCKIKMLHKKPSSTGSMSTCYFVNLPHISHGELMPLLFLSETRILLINNVLIHSALELCKKTWMF